MGIDAVAAEHVPARITRPAPGSVEELMAEATAKMGERARARVQLTAFAYPSRMTREAAGAHHEWRAARRAPALLNSGSKVRVAGGLGRRTGRGVVSAGE